MNDKMFFQFSRLSETSATLGTEIFLLGTLLLLSLLVRLVGFAGLLNVSLFWVVSLPRDDSLMFKQHVVPVGEVIMKRFDTAVYITLKIIFVFRFVFYQRGFTDIRHPALITHETGGLIAGFQVGLDGLKLVRLHMSLEVIFAGQKPRTQLTFFGIFSLLHRLSFVSDRIKFLPMLLVMGENVTRELVDVVVTVGTTILPSLPTILSRNKYLGVNIQVPPLGL